VNAVYRPARVTPGRSTSVAPLGISFDLPYTTRRQCSMCASKLPPAGSHFPCDSAHDGGGVVLRRGTVGHYFPGASGRLTSSARAAAAGGLGTDELAVDDGSAGERALHHAGLGEAEHRLPHGGNREVSGKARGESPGGVSPRPDETWRPI